MGLLLDRSARSPFLKVGTTRAVFQLSGNRSVLLEKLKISQRRCEITGNAMLTKWLAMTSDPNPNEFFILLRVVEYTTLVLNYVIVFSSLKLWVWLKLGHTQSLGVFTLTAPLDKICRSHHWLATHWRNLCIQRFSFETPLLLFRTGNDHWLEPKTRLTTGWTKTGGLWGPFLCSR